MLLPKWIPSDEATVKTPHEPCPRAGKCGCLSSHGVAWQATGDPGLGSRHSH